jgi:hypothetical protein
VKKLQIADKKLIMTRFFELLITNGYSLQEYLFLPASKINFKNVLLLINELETEAGIDEDYKFLFDNPQLDFLLKQK